MARSFGVSFVDKDHTSGYEFLAIFICILVMSSRSEHLILATIFANPEVPPESTVFFRGPVLYDSNPGVLTYCRVDVGDIRTCACALVVRPDSLGPPSPLDMGVTPTGLMHPNPYPIQDEVAVFGLLTPVQPQMVSVGVTPFGARSRLWVVLCHAPPMPFQQSSTVSVDVRYRLF
jgi:hypothetical protein